MKQQSGFVRLGKAMFAAGWVIGLIFLTLFFYDWERKQFNPNTQPVSTVSEQGDTRVRLQRNRYGHYVASGTINGQSVDFLLDTGASDVAVPGSLARRLGLPRGREQRSFTANGTIATYATTLDEVQLGGIRLQNIKASINPHMEGRQVLLGMSFLKRLDFQQQGDVLTLEMPSY